MYLLLWCRLAAARLRVSLSSQLTRVACQGKPLNLSDGSMCGVHAHTHTAFKDKYLNEAKIMNLEGL